MGFLLHSSGSRDYPCPPTWRPPIALKSPRDLRIERAQKREHPLPPTKQELGHLHRADSRKREPLNRTMGAASMRTKRRVKTDLVVGVVPT